jgi:hypothetical protein
VTAALLLLASLLAGGDPVHAAQAAAADGIMDRFEAAPRDPAVIRDAEALVDACLEAGNYRTAEFVAGHLVVQSPDRLRERHRYLRILVARGDAEQAERELRLHLRERPSDCAGYGLLAGFLGSSARWREAIAVHEAHLKEHPGDAGALRAAASILVHDLREGAEGRRAVARMRAEAERPGVPPRTASFLAANAEALERALLRREGEARVLAGAHGRAGRVLWGSVAGFALFLGTAFYATRRRG